MSPWKPVWKPEARAYDCLIDSGNAAIGRTHFHLIKRANLHAGLHQIHVELTFVPKVPSLCLSRRR